MDQDDDRLLALVEAVTDGRPVDWAEAESTATDPALRASIQHLRVLAGVARVARLHQSAPEDVSPGISADRPSWGPFEIRGTLGRGSFGRVYRAWDSHLDREVALKLLPVGQHAARLDSVAVDEGRLLARVRHENVVTVFGADRVDGCVGLWMELVAGRTLKEIHEEQGLFSPQEAAIIGLALCRAMAAVHRAGIVHRDIKTQNVMREAGGRIVLMDFGAAAAVDAASTTEKGTPLYLAPEVLSGAAPSVQSDVYSLGVLLFYLVSGEFPVVSASLDELREAHRLKRRRMLRDVRPDLPTAFVHAVDAATMALPGARPTSAGAMESLLEKVLGTATETRPSAPDGRRSVAVLPFSDVSPDKALDYFCDGVADEIINAISKVTDLRVVARTSSFQFKGRAEDVRQIGAMLNVATVLEGSVRAAGSQLRVISRLVDTAEGFQLWSERFDRSLDDVFAVQDEIARSVVEALRTHTGAAGSGGASVPGTPTTRSLEAYTLYLKGRHHWNKRTEGSLLKSAAYFQSAIDKDHRYAEAYAGLAEALATLGTYGAIAPKTIMPQAKAAAQQAIVLDPGLASAYATWGCVTAVHEWSWWKAEHYYRRAIELRPGDPSAHHWYAINYLVPLQRFDEAARELAAALDADPLSTPVRVSIGIQSYFARRYDTACAALRDSVEFDAQSATARLFLGLTLVEMGRYDDAVRELITAGDLADGAPEMIAALGYARARGGNTDHARESIASLVRLAGQRYVSPSLVAQVHASLGDVPTALEWLLRAVDERAADLAWLQVRPVFDALRPDGRFQELLVGMGF